MLERTLRTIERFIPRALYRFFQPTYHYALALTGALLYRFPSRKLFVVAITGTKGKSTTAELVNAVLEEAGHKTALLSTIRFKIGDTSERNLHKMTIPGRFFVQRFLREAVDAGCTHAVIEMTSEGARFFRHKFTALDALIVTNLTPEHIESHGSFLKYKDAKLAIARSLGRSWKRPRALIVNADMEHGSDFLRTAVETKLTYSLADAKHLSMGEHWLDFEFGGTKIHSGLRGEFNVSNMLAALTFGRSEHINPEAAANALRKISSVRGRVEKIDDGQSFGVIVDYAHTPDSLEKFYNIFDGKRRICVLGGTGGGRDKWKRPQMGRIAERYCDEIILTDEDPYDENPRDIILDIQRGIPNKKVKLMMDRRLAIREAFAVAKEGDVVLITGKGTDPYIMGPKGEKTPWDDAEVAREELARITLNTTR